MKAIAILFVAFVFSGCENSTQVVDYYPGKYQWKCNTDAECFEEERMCLASGECVRQR